MTRSKSQRIGLIEKAREAMLSAVQIFNNPLSSFKTESFIVLSVISWTYLLHAFYKKKGIEHRYFKVNAQRRRFTKNPDGSHKYWELTQCLDHVDCPLDTYTIANLKFLIGL